MEISRDRYLQELISLKHNGLIKIVSGIRRCGKSYLLFELFRRHLKDVGVMPDHIISITLDGRREARYRDPDVCYDYVMSQLVDEGMYYLLLDEVQLMEDFESVLNGLLRVRNLDIYVTGSNSRFLSSDVVTEFRGRGVEVRVYPLSFAEFYAAQGYEDEHWARAWEEYSLYGGMPLVLSYRDEGRKEAYLRTLMRETYIKDLIERNKIRNSEELEELVDMIASGIGGLTNAAKLERRFKSEKHVELTAPTIRQYLDHLQDAFVIDKSKRFDIKGKRYINTPCKYYMADMGLRNARLDFRQTDMPHIMENVIYNELCIRGYRADVGEVRAGSGLATEVDFVVNRGSSRFYIQSAWSIPDESKMAQEKRPLLSIRDTFRKMIIVGGSSPSYQDHDGILIISLRDFLLRPEKMERLVQF